MSTNYGRRHVTDVVSTGPSAPVLLDWAQTPFNVSVFVEVPVGVTASFSVEETGSDPSDLSHTPVWLTNANIGTGTATSSVTNYMFPIFATRLNVASISGGSIRLIVFQGQ